MLDQSWARSWIRGFTLIELMVALSIMAIVAAIALPLYSQYSQRAYRAEAQADLLNCAQSMERFAVRNFTYENAADSDTDGVGDTNNGLIAADICAPVSVTQGRYTIRVVGTTTTFVLTATPSSGTMTGDGLMTVNEAGRRGWDKNNDGDANDAGENSWED